MEEKPERDPVGAPISHRAAQKAMFVAQKVLQEIADDAEWEHIIGLIIGNLSGHAYVMIRRHLGSEAAEKWRGYVRGIRDEHVGLDNASRKYSCRVCENPFDQPIKTGSEASSSPCCRNHFTDEESRKIGRPCSRACCPVLDPIEAEEWDYRGD